MADRMTSHERLLAFRRRTNAIPGDFDQTLETDAPVTDLWPLPAPAGTRDPDQPRAPLADAVAHPVQDGTAHVPMSAPSSTAQSSAPPDPTVARPRAEDTTLNAGARARSAASGTTVASGDIVNTGTILLDEPDATWTFGPSVNLTGGGTVRLGGAASRILTTAPAPGAGRVAHTLRNQDNRIEGAGSIGSGDPDDGVVHLVNRPAGVVMANGTTELRILGAVNNTGTLGATGAGAGAVPVGGLRLMEDVSNSDDGVEGQGLVTAMRGGRVVLDGMRMTLGTLTTTDSGLITTAGAVTIDAARPMTLQARIVAGADSTLTMRGRFTQDAFVEAPSNGAQLSAGTGTLVLDGAAFTNGRLSSGAGGTVRIVNAVTLSGTTQPRGLPGFVSDAAIVAAAGSTLQFTGAVAHRGSISGAAGLSISGAFTNTGTIAGASLALSGTIDNTAGVLQVANGGRIDIGDGTTIRGGTLRAVGEAQADAAVIGASGAVTLDGTGEQVNNFGVLTARPVSNQNGPIPDRGLLLTGVVNQYSSPTLAGEIVADNGWVVLESATVQNGTLRQVGTGRFYLSGSSVLDGTTHGLTLPGELKIDRGPATLRGRIVNAGAVTIPAGRGAATLGVSGTVRLSGGGTIGLSSAYDGLFGGGAKIVGSRNGDVLENVDNSIFGWGQLGQWSQQLGLGAFALKNAAGGSVSAVGYTMRLFLGEGSFNRGLLQATTGTLVIYGAFDNAGGRIEANGGVVRLGESSTVPTIIAGGTLRTSGNGTVAVSSGRATLDGTASAVTIAGRLHVGGSGELTLAGAIDNTATLQVQGDYRATSVARLRIAGAVRLSGGGTVLLPDERWAEYSSGAALSGTSTADVLTNVNNVIAGYGNMGEGTLTFVNEAAGIVRATASTLTLDTGGETIVNRGLLESKGGTLTLASAVSNAGVIEARSGTVNLAGRVTGGTLRVAAGQQMNVNGGVSDSVLDFEGTGASMAIANAGQPISGTVRGLDDGDRLDFAGISATGRYSGGVLTLVAGGATVGSLVMAGATASDTFVAQANGAGGTRIVHQTVVPTNNDVRFTNVATGTSGRDLSEVYEGPVDYLRHQYIWASPDVVAMSAQRPGTFIKGGPGGDAILVTGGQNVLDGGGGSNFLVGGDGRDGGKDVFFVDSREELATWSTIVNFHRGDLATIFGFREGVSTRPFTDVDGAAGFTGVTIHSEIHGAQTGIKASLTFAGVDRATADAHFEVTSGVLPGDIGYLMIEYK